MKPTLEKLYKGYKKFRDKYHNHDDSIMEMLANEGQQPEVMVVACCDSRVDPALILQCHPGELFVVRNVANIVPPFENDEFHHGTSAALEFAICYLKIKHLIILGHSQCGGIQALANKDTMPQNDFITHWVSQTQLDPHHHGDIDHHAQEALHHSYQNCLTFPWLLERMKNEQLSIHRWFFDIKNAQILSYHEQDKCYIKLEDMVNPLS